MMLIFELKLKDAQPLKFAHVLSFNSLVSQVIRSYFFKPVVPGQTLKSHL